MSTTPEVILRLQSLPDTAVPAIPPHAASRRRRYRVDTAALHLPASLHLGHVVVEGTLLNLSTGGCCVALSGALPGTLRPGITVTVILPVEDAQAYVCPAEIRAVDGDETATRLHVYFCTLVPEARRALMTWIGALAIRTAAHA
jgi:c-di-GMP-binding flagellar brake protein YcgR